ncbi:MAG: glucosamine--fructose-6-phosphate aminotransferase (isomerizing) [Pseudorhodobacter sp.]|jgi:glucosamine--fructose-6-phosphate aminotransferase (isomerizing)
MTQALTQMRREILEIPSAVDRLLTQGHADMAAAAKALRDRNPAFIISVARGSSDHVATYFKYASELLMGVPVASVGPSVASVYKRKLHLAGSACVSVSQSGKSPDIVAMTRLARECGALSFAMTNNSASPLAMVSDYTLNLHAGPELSVAATKTFVTSAVSAIWLLAEWSGDKALLAAIRTLPEALEKAVQQSWPEVAATIGDRKSLFCLGRGPAYAISNEAALKFKETCQLHAESYSSAEVLHGPVSIIDKGFPVIALTAADEAEDLLVQVADDIAAKGAAVFVTSGKVKVARSLPVVRTGHPLTDPIALIASFYAMVETVAVARGINPDAPRHLNKVTETL